MCSVTTAGRPVLLLSIDKKKKKTLFFQTQLLLIFSFLYGSQYSNDIPTGRKGACRMTFHGSEKAPNVVVTCQNNPERKPASWRRVRQGKEGWVMRIKPPLDIWRTLLALSKGFRRCYIV